MKFFVTVSQHIAVSVDWSNNLVCRFCKEIYHMKVLIESSH